MSLQASVDALIGELAANYPETPFLALGQTVFWDEPMKAVWRRLLDENYPDARLIAGVHDTDYFAKTTALVHTDDPYVALPHDDARTRGLWSAAGELSALFGSEDLPTVAAYERNGVPFHHIAAEHPGDKLDFASRKTEAWGWRGIVGTGARQLISHDVPLDQFLPALEEELAWGFDLSIAQLAPERREAAQEIAKRIHAWVTDIAGQPERCCLSDLYEALLPRLYSLLLGEAPSNFETTASTLLFRFNTQTCLLPRFRFVDLFLNPATAAICNDAYNHAVAGGGMYTLDEFGIGALPFDIVAPGIGRGTLHVTGNSVVVDLPGESKLSVTGVHVTSIAELAQLLESRLGQEIALVGKAVSLIGMISAEFLIVFHETASGYTDRTTTMNDAIRAAGIELDLKPIVRVQYPTWDALAALGEEVQFDLPPHLAQAFGKGQITAAEFSSRWSSVVTAQKAVLKTMRDLRSPRALVQYLADSGDLTHCWPCHLDIYNKAQGTLTEQSESVTGLKTNIAELRSERYALRQRIDRLQREKGEFFRGEIRPLQEALASATDEAQIADLQTQLAFAEDQREADYTLRLEALHAQVSQWTRVINQWRAELRRIERSEIAQQSRSAVRRVVFEAECARLEHVRAALITSASLPHTQARPTAWWLPMVDPSGRWFAAIAEGTTARLERV